MVPDSLSARRRASGYALAVLGGLLLAAALSRVRSRLDLASDALLFLLLVVGTAILGGWGPPWSRACSTPCCCTSSSPGRSTPSTSTRPATSSP